MAKPPFWMKSTRTALVVRWWVVPGTLFATAFVQVLLVSLNTVLLAHKQIAPSIACAFLISYVWTFNVKRAAFGSNIDKLIYSLGAACGSAVGIYLAGLIL